MGDEEVLDRIRTLVDEEHVLRAADELDVQRIAHVEETLDQCWDLLRQRRALREFGEDDADAKMRDVGTVEHYRQ